MTESIDKGETQSEKMQKGPLLCIWTALVVERGARDGSAQDAADHLDDAQVVPFPTEYIILYQANITSG